MRLTRRYRFSASHRLHSPALSHEENKRVYGKCNNPYGHGHDYVLEVSVEGRVDARNGRVVALGDLDELVGEHVLSVYSGKNMNTDIAAFAGEIVPTTENVCADVWHRLEAAWPEVGHPWRRTPLMPKLAGVRVFETPKNVFET